MHASCTVVVSRERSTGEMEATLWPGYACSVPPLRGPLTGQLLAKQRCRLLHVLALVRFACF